ncbi:helix-turn-helix domain-containing protein [Saccharopolyspora sp. NPDC049357]|uniref:TetR/AcrR family transcriptional regulator n=1 Tax=Saccharopolyspora sp. NPDC049357 TaxID=3154507 RepID=UPI00344A5174
MTRSTAPASGRKRMSRAERETQILEVAERIFAHAGYQATSMDDIASQVGLSKPMLYEYFGSKEGLLLACLQRSKAELLEATSRAAAEATSPEQKLHDCQLAFFRFSDDHAQAWALLRNEFSIPSAPVNTELEAIRVQQRYFTADLLRTVCEDLDHQQAEVYAEAIIGASERLALWRDHHPEVTAEKATEHMIALFAPGLGF